MRQHRWKKMVGTSWRPLGAQPQPQGGHLTPVVLSLADMAPAGGAMPLTCRGVIENWCAKNHIHIMHRYIICISYMVVYIQYNIYVIKKLCVCVYISLHTYIVYHVHLRVIYCCFQTFECPMFPGFENSAKRLGVRSSVPFCGFYSQHC